MVNHALERAQISVRVSYPSGDRDMVQSGLSSPAIARGT